MNDTFMPPSRIHYFNKIFLRIYYVPVYILDASKTGYQPWGAHSPLEKQWYKLIVTKIHCNKFCNRGKYNAQLNFDYEERAAEGRFTERLSVRKAITLLEVVKNKGTHSDHLGSILALLFISCASLRTLPPFSH